MTDENKQFKVSTGKLLVVLAFILVLATLVTERVITSSENNDFREHFSEIEAQKCMVPIFDAVMAAHGMNVVHRDLKPENILMSDKDLE